MSIVCISHNLFIHLSSNGHLGCFHLLAIMNSAAIDMRIYVILFNYLVICLGMDLLDYIVILCLKFLKNCKTVFHSSCTIFHSHQPCKFQFLHIFANTYFPFLFIVTILLGVKCYYIWFWFALPDLHKGSCSSFHVILDTCILSLLLYMFKSFTHFFKVG